MIFRVSNLVVASLAAFAVSPVNSKRLKKQHIMLSGQLIHAQHCLFNVEEDSEEETNVVNSKNTEKVVKPNLTLKRNCGKLELDREWIEYSQDVIKDLETRRVTLEGKLLQLYAQKQKLSHIAFLQRNLDGKTAEIDNLNFTIFALKAEIRDLQEIIRQGNLATTQLEIAKKMIEQMQLKNGDSTQIKAQVVGPEEQLSRFTANQTSPRDALVKKRLEAL
ncbi:hypothetical protein PTKIN_Ptkin04bG0119900 [Pterospermum kingtungense]